MDAFEEYPDETPTERESEDYQRFCARMSSRTRQQLRPCVRFAVEAAAHNTAALELFPNVRCIGDARVQAN